MGWEYLLPYPLMMLGMWLWLKRRLGRSDAAMFGGLVFTFSSFNLLHFVHPNAVAVIAHIPWLLWAIDVVLADSRRRRVALATALIALLTGSQLLLGYPQYVWFSLLAEFSYAVFLLTAHSTPRGPAAIVRHLRRLRRLHHADLAALLIAKGIGLLIGGVQLLPSFDAWLHSARLLGRREFLLLGLAPSLEPAATGGPVPVRRPRDRRQHPRVRPVPGRRAAAADRLG